MNEFFANFNNVAEFNYSVHISDEFRFVYFNNPKCACTTIKASLNLACAAALGRHLKYRDIGDIHNRNYNLLRTPAELGYSKFEELLGDPSYFKFSFIREPVQRIASAFASKLTWGSDSRVALNRMLHRPDCAPMTFVELIRAFSADDKIRDSDEHWRLQRKQICYDLVKFDKIGLFEDLEAELQAVLQRVFDAEIKRPIFDVRQHFSGNASGSHTLAQSLTDDTRAVISRIYRDDLDLYLAAGGVPKAVRGIADGAVADSDRRVTMPR